MNRRLLHNDELREPGRPTARWQVVDPTPRDGWIKLFDHETHQEKYRPLSEIIDDIVHSRLILTRHRTPRVSAAAQDDQDLDKDLQMAHACLRRIEHAQKKYGVAFRKAYEIAREEHKRDADAERDADAVEGFPSRATAYRYAEAKRNGLPLLQGDANKGNRSARYAGQVVDMICSAANGLFLKPGSKWTLSDLAAYVNDQAREFGWLAEGQRIGRTFVSKTIVDNLSVDPEIDRMDPKLVAAAKSIAKNRIVAASPFARVEQDALHLPFVVSTQHGVSSSVYWIHAIDCWSGMPVGWRMVVGAPTESDGLACVESILFSKKDKFAELGLTYDIDMYGTPHQLVFDNGAEARGERMHRLVRLDIDIMHCKSRHAHGKPYIERLNRSLKEALQTLPGCTRFDGKDGQRDPVALGDKLMTEKELERWIVRWYVESWANSELKRHLRSDFHDTVKLGSTPAMRWKRITQELAYAVPLPPPRSEWLMTLYEHEVRTLSRKTGITCSSGFNYKGENLPYLLEKYGEVRLNVLVNPDDYRQIYVNEGDDMPLVPLTEEFVDETTPAYSVAYMKEQAKAMKPNSSESAAKAAFRRDVHAHSIESTGKPSRKKQSKAERNRETANRFKESKAIHRAIENPVAPPRRTSTATNTQPVNNSFDDAPTLPVLNRMSGEKQK